MKNLEKITVIIPSMNRQKYALSTLKYWSDFNVNVHLVDGSATPISVEKIKDLNSKVFYHHIKILSELERIKKIVNLINTPYVILSSDDDILLPNALNNCVNELEVHTDYASCFGQVVGFKHIEDEANFYNKYSELYNYSIISSDREKRLMQHMRNYIPSIILSVIRTDIFKLIFNSNNSSKISSLAPESHFASFELRTSLLVTYCGKSKVLPNLLMLRNENNKGVRARTQKNTSFIKWWYSPSTKSDKNAFIMNLVNSVQEENEREKNKKLFKKSLKYYLIWNFIRLIKIKIPHLIKMNIPYFYYKNRKKNSKKLPITLKNLNDFCQKKNIHLHHDDLSLVKEIVKEKK